MWSRQSRAGDLLLSTKIPEPPLPRLEALNNRMTRGMVVGSCVLSRRTIAAANVATLRTTAQMKPPGTFLQTFDTPRTTWSRIRVYSIHRHVPILSSCTDIQITLAPLSCRTAMCFALLHMFDVLDSQVMLWFITGSDPLALSGSQYRSRCSDAGFGHEGLI